MKPSDLTRINFSTKPWLAQGAAFNGAANPGAGVVIVDSGALAAGYYDINVRAFTNTLIDTMYFYWQHRNAANDASVYLWAFVLPALGTSIIELRNWKVAAGERIRLAAAGGWTGAIWGDVTWVRRF